MEDTVGFGPVVLESKCLKTVQLANLGDVGAKFIWEDHYCNQIFSIHPHKGYIPPHEDIYFEITFHPTVVNNDIRFNKVFYLFIYYFFF